MLYNIEQYSIFDKETGLIDLQADICIRLRELPIKDREVLTSRATLDAISYAYYNTYDLWWVLAVYNKIINPFNLTKQTDVINIPSFVEVQNILIKDAYVRV